MTRPLNNRTGRVSRKASRSPPSRRQLRRPKARRSGAAPRLRGWYAAPGGSPRRARVGAARSHRGARRPRAAPRPRQKSVASVDKWGVSTYPLYFCPFAHNSIDMLCWWVPSALRDRASCVARVPYDARSCGMARGKPHAALSPHDDKPHGLAAAPAEEEVEDAHD